jgi:chromosome segregation ATPase
LLELYAGHGQNRFYRELEEWLASITRVSLAASEGDGGGIDRSAVATVLDHMVDQVETLQSLFAQSEARRADTEARLLQLTGAIEGLVGQLGTAPYALAEGQERLASGLERLAAGQERNAKGQERLAEGQDRFAAAQERLALGQDRFAAGQERLAEVLAASRSTPAVDEESRLRLRSIDLQLLKIYEELGTTRDAEILLLRRDIGDLTQALRDLVAAARTPPRPPRSQTGE